MDFALSTKAEEVSARMWAFMREEIFPAETEYETWRANNDPHAHPPVLERLKASARRRDLWNLFLPRYQACRTWSTPLSRRSRGGRR